MDILSKFIFQIDDIIIKDSFNRMQSILGKQCVLQAGFSTGKNAFSISFKITHLGNLIKNAEKTKSKIEDVNSDNSAMLTVDTVSTRRNVFSPLKHENTDLKSLQHQHFNHEGLLYPQSVQLILQGIKEKHNYTSNCWIPETVFTNIYLSHKQTIDLLMNKSMKQIGCSYRHNNRVIVYYEPSGTNKFSNIDGLFYFNLLPTVDKIKVISVKIHGQRSSNNKDSVLIALSKQIKRKKGHSMARLEQPSVFTTFSALNREIPKVWTLYNADQTTDPDFLNLLNHKQYQYLPYYSIALNSSMRTYESYVRYITYRKLLDINNVEASIDYLPHCALFSDVLSSQSTLSKSFNTSNTQFSKISIDQLSPVQVLNLLEKSSDYNLLRTSIDKVKQQIPSLFQSNK